MRGVRLIPARAGNMLANCAKALATSAHPRSRGEHDCTAYRVGFVTGSSPLARGTYLLTWGFIPYISKIESL